MKTVYIKFRHKDDIYAINQSYDLRPPGDDFVPSRICPRCGDTLYIPVEFPEDVEITQPMGEIYRPFPTEKPDFVIRSEPEPITLYVPLQKPHPAFDEFDEIKRTERLKRFDSMTFVDANGFEMLIEDISRQPVKHKCPPSFN